MNKKSPGKWQPWTATAKTLGGIALCHDAARKDFGLVALGKLKLKGVTKSVSPLLCTYLITHDKHAGTCHAGKGATGSQDDGGSYYHLTRRRATKDLPGAGFATARTERQCINGPFVEANNPGGGRTSLEEQNTALLIAETIPK
jgi:hypothetical protein